MSITKSIKEVNVRITFHVSDSLEEEIKKIAKQEKKSVSSFVAEAISFYIKEQKRRKAAEEILALTEEGAAAPDTLDELDRMRKEDENRF